MERGNVKIQANTSKSVGNAAKGLHSRVHTVSAFSDLESNLSNQTSNDVNNLYSNLLKECERLRNEMQNRDRDSLEIVNFLRNDIEEKSNTIKDLRQSLIKAENTEENFVKSIRNHYESIISEKDKIIESLEKENKRIRKNFNEILEFKRQKIELVDKLKTSQNCQQKLVDEYEDEIARLKYVNTEERVKIKILEEKMNDTFCEGIEKRANAIAKNKNQELHVFNERCIQDNQLLKDELTDLIKLSTAYKGEKDELKVKAKVNEDLYLRSINHSATLNLQFDGLDSKLENTEEGDFEIVEKDSAEGGDTMNKKKLYITHLKKQLNNAFNIIKTQNKDLIKMRTLSNHILSRHEEIEKLYACIEVIWNNILFLKKNNVHILSNLESNSEMIQKGAENADISSSVKYNSDPYFNKVFLSTLANEIKKNEDIFNKTFSSLNWNQKKIAINALFLFINKKYDKKYESTFALLKENINSFFNLPLIISSNSVLETSALNNQMQTQENQDTLNCEGQFNMSHKSGRDGIFPKPPNKSKN